MSKKTTSAVSSVPTAPPRQYTPLRTLKALEDACDQPVVVDVVLHGTQPVRLTGRRLLPREQRRIQELLNRAIPPVLPSDKPDAEPQYDWQNAEYVTARETHRRTARALTLWYAFDLFRTAYFEEQKPNRPGVEPTDTEILDFIESRKLDVGVLDYMQDCVAAGIAYVDTARVGFTSGSGVPKN